MIAPPRLTVGAPDLRCKVCGRALTANPRGGRPPDYCAGPRGQSDCYRLAMHLGAAMSLLHVVVDSAGDENPSMAMAARSFLWREVNSATNRGKLHGVPGRKPYNNTASFWRYKTKGPDPTPVPVDAVDAVLRGAGLGETARKFGVPRSTLGDHVRRRRLAEQPTDG